MNGNEIPIKVEGSLETSRVEQGLQRLSRLAQGLNTDFTTFKRTLGSLGSAGGFDPSRMSADGRKYREEITKADGKTEIRERDATRGERMAAGGLRGYQAVWSAIGSATSNATNLVGRNLTSAGMYSNTAIGLDSYKKHLEQLDDEARAVKSLTESYEQYRQKVKDAGSDYGFTNDQVIALSSQLGHTNGRAGAGRLTEEMRTIQGISRGYGMSLDQGADIFTQSTRQGITGGASAEMSARSFAGLIADAVSQGGMQGRESEVISSIQGLSATMNNRLVSPQNTGYAASLLATMNATGVRGLQGEQGASLLSQVDQGIKNPGAGEAGNMFEYRALTGGKGGMRYGAYERLKEQGLGGVNDQTGKTNFQSILESLQNSGLDDDQKALQARSLLGVSMDQFNGKNGLVNTFFKNGKFDAGKLGGLQTALGGDFGKVDPSMFGMISDLQAAKGDPTKVAAVAKSFQDTTGQKPVSTTDAGQLLEQMKTFGKGNVALSEGQQRSKLDADLAKAGEQAASHLYDLMDASDKLAKKMYEITGSGPLGGMLPMVAGSVAGGLLNFGTSKLLGWGQQGGASLIKQLLGRGGAAAGGEAAAAGAGAAEGSTAAAAGGTAAGAGLLAFGGGLLAGGGAAFGGSAFAQHFLGTQGLGDATGVALHNAGQIASGQSGNSWGDVGNAVGSVALSPFAATAGLIRGGASAAMGGSFQDSYNKTFFGAQDFFGLHSQGGDQYHASQNPANAPGLSSEMSQQLRDAMQSGRMEVAPITIMLQHPDGTTQTQQVQATVRADPFAGLVTGPTRSVGS